MSCESQRKDGREKVVHHDFYFVYVHHRVEGSSVSLPLTTCMYSFPFSERGKDDEQSHPPVMLSLCLLFQIGLTEGRDERRETRIIGDLFNQGSTFLSTTPSSILCLFPSLSKPLPLYLCLCLSEYSPACRLESSPNWKATHIINSLFPSITRKG